MNHGVPEGAERIRTAEQALGADPVYDALEALANSALLVVAGCDPAHLDDALHQADELLVAAGRWLPWDRRGAVA